MLSGIFFSSDGVGGLDVHAGKWNSKKNRRGMERLGGVEVRGRAKKEYSDNLEGEPT